MKIAFFPLMALFAYLISGLNPAIILSKMIYHQDIRELGSKNPGFTNFKSAFGGRYAWIVFFLDIFKGAVVSVVAGLLARTYLGDWQLGVAHAGIFALLGHAFPVEYGFKGGKGFLVCFSTVWFIDWRAGLIAFGVLALLLLSTKYMSLSTMLSLAAGAVSIALFGAGLPACLLYTAGVLFVVARHHENIRRLVKGTESRFFFGGKKKEN